MPSPPDPLSLPRERGRRLAQSIWHWLPVLVWMALILSLSGRSDLPVRTNPQTGETIKTTFTAAKLTHVFEYSVLALLTLRALAGKGGGLELPLRTAMVATVALAAAFGAVDEFRQSFVPGREPRLTDVLLDATAALVTMLAVLGWRRYRGTSPHPPTPGDRPHPPTPSPASGRGGADDLAPPLRAGEGAGGVR